MLDDLKFVRSAVATKDFVPELTHFRICDGKVTGFNGELSICSPVPIDLDIAPQAAHFMKAINACDDTISLKMVKERLQVRSGKFKTFVPVVPVDDVPALVPVGTKVEPGFSLVKCFKLLEPFIGTDASKPWANGILFKGQSAFATNNIVIIEFWLNSNLPTVNIPHLVVKEVIRYGEEPTHLLIDNNRITFFYENGRWISSILSALDWPNVDSVLPDHSQAEPFPTGFFDGVKKLVRFGDDLGRCYLKPGTLSTSAHDDVEGAVIDCEGVFHEGCYNLKALSSLNEVATSIDFSVYPKPAPFYGEGVRGVLVGYRV